MGIVCTCVCVCFKSTWRQEEAIGCHSLGLVYFCFQLISHWDLMSASSAILAVQEGPSSLFSLLPCFRDQMHVILKGAKWLVHVLMLSRQTLPPESPPQPFLLFLDILLPLHV